MSTKHNHYFKDVSKLEVIDVYRVLKLFAVIDPCIGHAIKKLLVAGGRGHKDITKDIQEAIDSLTRWQDMRTEEALHPLGYISPPMPCANLPPHLPPVMKFEDRPDGFIGGTDGFKQCVSCSNMASENYTNCPACRHYGPPGNY